MNMQADSRTDLSAVQKAGWILSERKQLVLNDSMLNHFSTTQSSEKQHPCGCNEKQDPFSVSASAGWFCLVRHICQFGMWEYGVWAWGSIADCCNRGLLRLILARLVSLIKETEVPANTRPHARSCFYYIMSQ